jgi:hypothetical protein
LEVRKFLEEFDEVLIEVKLILDSIHVDGIESVILMKLLNVAKLNMRLHWVGKW